MPMSKREPPTPIACTSVRPEEPYFQPVSSYPDDAGVDFTVSRDTLVGAGCFALLPTNLKIALYPGWWGLLVGRSSTFYKKNLMVNPGIIDSGYRGEIQAMVYNPTDRRLTVKSGERLFQMIIMSAHSQKFGFAYTPAGAFPEAFADLGPVRGAAGFGSTGGFDADAK